MKFKKIVRLSSFILILFIFSWYITNDLEESLEESLIAKYSKKENEKENENEISNQETPAEEIKEKTKENQSKQSNNTNKSNNKNKNAVQKKPSSSQNETGSTETPQNNNNNNTPAGQANNSTSENKNNQQNSNQSDYTREVVRLCNNYRQEAGIANLSNQNSKLQQAANIRCEEIKQNFSHTRPNGTSAYTVLNEVGLSYNTWGENIAYGQKTPEAVVNAWMSSPGHRANILNKNFKQIAVGMKDNYWVQIFI